MLVWKIEDSKIRGTVDIDCLNHLLAGKCDLDLQRHVEKGYDTIQEALGKMEILVLYYRKVAVDNTRAYVGQTFTYRSFAKTIKPLMPKIREYTDTDPVTRPELAKSIQFLKKNRTAAILMRIDCLTNNDMPVDERQLLLLFRRRDLIILEHLFPEEVQAERNARRSRTLKKTLKNQTKAPSLEILQNREKARSIGAVSNRLKALERDEKHLELICDLYSKGMGLTAIADELNNQSQEKRWYPMQVSRVLKRFEQSKP
jgi:hypothetical protein